MRFDDILEEVDGFGPFQLLLIMLLCFPRLVVPCHFLLNNFIAGVPAHHCHLGPLDLGGLHANLSAADRVRVGIPTGPDGSLRSCEMFSEPQLHLLTDATNSSAASTVRCSGGWVYDNSTFTSTVASEWDLVCDRKGMPNVMGTIFFLGVMLGTLAFGALCDKFGGRSVILVSYIMSTVFAFGSAFSNSYPLFAVLRFFTGFSLTGIGIITTVLSIEWVDVGHRTFTGVIGGIAWTIGNMLLAGLAYMVNDWRTLIMTVTSPLFAAVLTWWWVPESARWLLANGQVERAQFYLDKCATFNNKKKIKLQLEQLSSVEPLEKKSRNYSYLDLIKHPKMRKLSLLTSIIWYGVTSTYYGISMNISGFGLNLYLTHFIYAAIELPAKLLAYFFLNIFGRRKCLAGTLLLTGTCIAINIFVPKAYWQARTTVAILGKGLSEASFTTVILYTTELFPTVVRQNGMGLASFIGRVGTSLALLILLLEDVWTLLPAVLFCSVAMMCGLLALLLPETCKMNLPETIEDVEQSDNWI